VTLISVLARLLFAIVIFSAIYISWQKPQQKLAVAAAQRMCPHCGRITPRSEAACLECGGPLIP